MSKIFSKIKNKTLLLLELRVNYNGVNALFVPTFRGRFYFGPYIYILPILVPNPINAYYFSLFRQPTDGNG